MSNKETPDPVSGINLSGYFRDESGWGAAGRSYIRALRALELPLALHDVSALTTNRSGDATIRAFDDAQPYDLNLVCVDPSQHFAFLSHVGASYFQDHYNIGAWAWELPRFPANWFNRFAFYDEIWVTTSFVANALAPVAPLPVVRIPPVLTPTRVGSREQGRQQLGADADEFVFLFIFDFHSHMERKNPLAVVDAFKQAFAREARARLVIKTVNAEADAAGFAALQARARGFPIRIINGYWSADAVRDLMAACDVYISLHRSEGTGLTITDAMALGKPVIATGWSGNMDFMTASNSFPVRYELVEIERGVGPYREGERWAEPSVAHAAELMRHVFEHQDQARTVGERARRDLETYFSPSAVADLIKTRLEAIRLRRDLSAFQQRNWAAFRDYQELAGHLRQAVERVVPAGSTVMVISKGDDRLLELGAARGWHLPQTEQGTYAGYHPADSEAAIAQVQAMHERGADYLLIPQPSFWWLNYYGEFANNLEQYGDKLWSDAHCIVYRINDQATNYGT